VRVLHVTPSIQRSYGGPTESLIGYITASQAAGIEVSVAAPRCTDDEAQAFAARVGSATIRLFPSFGNGAFAVSPALLRWVGKESRSQDVVHVHGLFNTTSSLAARSCIRQQIPVAIRPFGTLSRYTFLHRRTTLKRTYLVLVERRNVEHASAIHFTTETERANAEWHGIQLGERSHVIPPPAPAVTLRPRIHARDASEPKVLFLGRIVPVKNIESLLDAWPFVLRVLPNARLNIAGSGDESYVRTLKERAGRLGVSGTVSFTGFADSRTKGELIDSASLFVLPSHHENFGIAVIEALAASLPVVISPQVQLAPFVEANRLGLVSETAPSALAAAIVRCVGDRELHEHVRTNGPAALAASFSPVRVGRLLLQMYHDAVEFSTTRPQRK
jgi:glycosyltransferase involved in cell wall biosynthesis